MKYAPKVLLALLLGSVAVDAFAQGATSSLLTQYQVQQSTWLMPVLNAANTLFWLLAAIQFVWAAIKLTLERQDMQGFLAGFIHQLMWIGAFYALLINGPIWIPAIVNSFINIGRDVAAFGATELYPGNVVGRGVEIAMKLLDGAAKSGFFNNPATSLVLVLAALVVLVSFCLIAAQMLVALVESYMVTTAGLLFLGFGGSKWTAPYVERFIGLAVSVGIKLFVLYLLVAVGYQMSNQWAIQVAGIGAMAEAVSAAFGIMGASLCFLMVCWQSPKLVSSMIGGSPQLTGGDLIGATAGVATGGSGLASSVAGAVGYAAGRSGEPMTGSQAAAMGAVAAGVATGGVGAAVGAASTGAASTSATAATLSGSASSLSAASSYVAPPAVSSAAAGAPLASRSGASVADAVAASADVSRPPVVAPRRYASSDGEGDHRRAPSPEHQPELPLANPSTDAVSTDRSASIPTSDDRAEDPKRLGTSGSVASRSAGPMNPRDEETSSLIAPPVDTATRDAARAGDPPSRPVDSSSPEVPPPGERTQPNAKRSATTDVGTTPPSSLGGASSPRSSIHDATRAASVDEPMPPQGSSGYEITPPPDSGTAAAREVDRSVSEPRPNEAGTARRVIDQLTRDAAQIPPTAPKLVDPSDD